MIPTAEKRPNPIVMAKMAAKARLKKMAGADTTAAGEPDYAKMFLSMMHRLASVRAEKPDTLGERTTMHGITIGGDDK